MAEDKKSVLLYCDIIHTVEKLDDETAGKLFKHYLRYINDQDPQTEDIVVDIAFEPMKQNLKRDLKKWEARANKSRENGKKGGRPKEPKETQITQQVILEPRKPVKDKVTVTVIDTVKVKDIDILLKKETKGRFKPPSLLEIDSLIKKREYKTVIGETFFNHYEANGWKVGKNKMKDWGAALAGWESRNKNENNEHQKNSTRNNSGTAATNFSGAEFDEAEN